MEAPTRIEVVGRTTVRLEWEDRPVREIDAATLRQACACADCRSRPPRPPTAVRLAVSGGATIEHAQLVGDYGVSFAFGPDGHRTGIFTWDMLAAL
jgi:DUF971 family protein